MASLSRKFLSSIGIDDEKADLIIEKHTEVITEIKDDRDKYKAEAEKLPDIQKQLDEYKQAAQNASKDTYKVKYDALKEDFDNFKADIAKKETTAKKETAYRELLKSAGVSEKRIPAVLKVSDVDAIEFDDDGKIKGADDLTKTIKSEWADFIEVRKTEGAATATPPVNGTNAVKSKKEIMEIKDTAARQNAWKEYISANTTKGT